MNNTNQVPQIYARVPSQVLLQMRGAAQVPLVLLLWSALVMFFGHQYQAFALLPDAAGTAQRLDQDLDGRRHQQIDRLLDEMVQQPPPAVPELLDPKDFALDLADALANTDVARGDWVVQPRTQSRPQVQPQAQPPAQAQQNQRTQVQVKPQPKAKAAIETSSPIPVATVPTAQKSAHGAQPKFVRLPARANRSLAMQVDALRPLKDQARAALTQGNAGAAYALLRGQVQRGRTDIEFLGLLALASLQQHADEARVLYEHLAQLQPDEVRWQHALSLLNRSKTSAKRAA